MTVYLFQDCYKLYAFVWYVHQKCQTYLVYLVLLIYIDILYFRYIDHVHCASSISAVPYL